MLSVSMRSTPDPASSVAKLAGVDAWTGFGDEGIARDASTAASELSSRLSGLAWRRGCCREAPACRLGGGACSRALVMTRTTSSACFPISGDFLHRYDNLGD